jgi:hypothetical protein
MERVSIEVHSGAARFRVAVRAQSIQRALGLLGERYHNHEIRSKFEPPKKLAA